MRAPDEPVVNLNPSAPSTTPASPPAQVTPTPAKPPIMQVDPGTPTDIVGPTTGNGTGSSMGKPPVNSDGPTTNDVIFPKSNYNIFGNNTPDYRPLIIFCCLCILGLGVIALVAFILIIHKRNLNKQKLPGLKI